MKQFQLHRTLRELSTLTPEADATRRAMAAARSAVSSRQRRKYSVLRTLSMSPRRLAFAAAAAAAVLIISLLVLDSGSRNVTFAQVVAQTEQAKTVQYLETRSDIPKPGELRGPSWATKVMTSGRSRERKEIISLTKGDPLPDGAMWTEPMVGHISISDWARGKLVSLDPAEKTFSEARFLLSIQDDGKIEKSAVAAAPEVDFYKQMREFSAKDAVRLPQRDIDGKSVIGFRTVEVIKRQAGTDTWTRTYWVDRRTNLPVQIEVTAESTDPHRGQSKWVKSDIIFDAPLDESLFSTDPPDGYAVAQ